MGLEGASHLGKFLTVRERETEPWPGGQGLGRSRGCGGQLREGAAPAAFTCPTVSGAVSCFWSLSVFFLLMPKSKKYFGSLVLCASAL